MTQVSTHVLDLTLGRPARDVAVRLEKRESDTNWRLLASARTDQNGRCAQLMPENDALTPGIYRLVFDTESYFGSRKLETLYPSVEITFYVREGEQHFHLPLLLSPHGYSTYRGT
jgi:5-hydroxyisourate hydrolase